MLFYQMGMQSTLPHLKSKFQQKYLQRNASQDQEIFIVELEGRDREHKLLIDQLKCDIKLKESIIDTMKDENSKLKDKIENLEDEVKELEEELKKTAKLQEMEQILGVVKEKNAKICELEEALRQSVSMTSDMEAEKKEENDRMEEITVKLNELDEKLRKAKEKREKGEESCPICPLLKEQLNKAKEQLQILLQERRTHLEELFDLKNKNLLEALSEKDAQIARLEEVGLRTEEAKQEYKTLTQAKAVLLNAIQKQGEERVRLLQEFHGNGQMEDPRNVPRIEVSAAEAADVSEEEESDEE